MTGETWTETWHVACDEVNQVVARPDSRGGAGMLRLELSSWGSDGDDDKPLGRVYLTPNQARAFAVGICSIADYVDRETNGKP
jgi:hypothetical protein